ncbi:hypothetical protein F4803DRAFT_547633 [Xylaria telfairii]|nr:hypothetical protein F4803DRAFT_547633 [Xylaria telfairii]
MSSRKVPLTFTFRRHGAHPPLFVAGSFSDPPWQPLEMDASIDQHGDLIFIKQVMVDESSEVQYKFRHASGDWWALDPDVETVTDEHGNVNNLLLSPSKYAAQETTLSKETHDSKIRDTAGETAPDNPNTETGSAEGITKKDEPRRLSSTPIEEVANTAAEVADSASQLGDDDLDVESSDILPMLSHECFASPSNSPASGYQESEPQREMLDQLNMDYDDPRLEHFPSDRSSIMATMRRLSTSIDADSTMVDTAPLSPVTTARSGSSSGPSPRNSLNLDEPNTAQRQTGDVSRHPTSIAARRPSLKSIAEGEEASNKAGMPDCPGSVSPKCKTPIHPKEPEVLLAITTDKTKRHSTLPKEEYVPGSTKASESNDEGSSLQKPTDGERPHFPSTTCPTSDNNRSSWLHTFIHTMYVDRIGGFVYRLYSRGRNQV